MDIGVPSGRVIGGRCIVHATVLFCVSNEFKTSKSRFCCPLHVISSLFSEKEIP